MSTGWNGPLEFRSSLTLWGQAKEAAVPIVTYWIWITWAFLTFCAAIAGNGMNMKDMGYLAGFGIATFLGVALGQTLAFMRVRTWPLIVISAVMWFIFFVFLAGGGSALMANDVIAMIAVSVLLIGPIAMTGGLWSLETNRALWSTWLPMVFTVGAVATWVEEHGKLSTWEGGEKWAIWDGVALFMFVPSVCLFLLFLVTRETHRLAMWKRGPTAPLRPTVEERGVSRPRLTILGVLALGALALAVAGASAVVAPYLWRTGPPDDNGPEETTQGTGDPQPNPDMPDMPEGMQQVLEKAAEAAKEAAGTICSVLSIAMMALLGALLAYRPIKRLLVVRHLKDPFWDESPTTRIDQSWRLVEIALGDAGVLPIPGEDAAGLARRAGPVLKQISPVQVHGLDEVAEVADRVRFGLGVGPEDVAVMERFSRWVLDTVWERLDDKQQMAAMYRGI